MFVTGAETDNSDRRIVDVADKSLAGEICDIRL